MLVRIPEIKNFMLILSTEKQIQASKVGNSEFRFPNSGLGKKREWRLIEPVTIEQNTKFLLKDDPDYTLEFLSTMFNGEVLYKE